MSAEKPGKPRPAVNSHLSAVPRNLFSQMTSLTEKERYLQRHAATVRSQIAEIQRRSTTLQQYANDLVEMDKKLHAAENELEAQYQNRLSEMADQEDEYLHTLARIREQKQEIDQRLGHSSQVSATILDSIKATQQEESELKVTNVNIESLTTRSCQRIAQTSLERLHFEVSQEEKRIGETTSAIDQERIVVKEISAQGDDLLQTLNQAICHQRELESRLSERNGIKSLDSDEIRQKIQSSKDDYSQCAAEEIKLMAMQSILRKDIKKLKQKYSDARQATLEFTQAVKPHRDHLAINNGRIEDVRRQTRQFQEALDQQLEFWKGIRVSTDRAKLREQEMQTALGLIRSQAKKATLETFLKQDEMDELSLSERSVSVELAEVDHDIEVFAEEEEEFDRQCSTMSLSVTVHEEQERDFHSLVDSHHKVQRSLKGKIRELRKEERAIVKRLKQLRGDVPDYDGPEIDRERRRWDVLIKGYQTQLVLAEDQVTKIARNVKVEELKANVAMSEQRRIVAGLSVDRPSDVSLDEQKKRQKQKLKTQLDELEDLRERREALQAKLANRRLAIAEKTKKVEDDMRELPAQSRQSELALLQAGFEQRREAAERFCRLAQAATAGVAETIKVCKANEKVGPGSVKEWYQTVSAMINEMEELNLRIGAT
jgi:hypothetical protein